jgi:FlaA1/EpsC-like NDP-sugar epimerase
VTWRPIVLDAALAALGAALAVVIVGGTPVEEAVSNGWLLIPLAAVARPAADAVLRVDRRIWRYATVADLRPLLGALALGTAAVAGGALALRAAGAVGAQGIEVTVIVLETALATITLGGRRLVGGLQRRHLDLGSDVELGEPPRRVLLYGAGELGALLASEMTTNRLLNLDPVAFVDDDRSKLGLAISGVQVRGTGEDIPAIVAELDIREVIVAQSRIPASRYRQVADLCATVGVPVRALPGMPELLDETVTLSRVRPVHVEQLLGRNAHELPDATMRGLVAGRSILVTGAGGSIGAELSRQVAELGARRIVLFEQAETPVFFIDEEIHRRFPGVDAVAVIGDVADEHAVAELFAREQPEVVFHAAAHKHVPLSESNVRQTVWANVRGTRVVTEAAATTGSTLIFVSTDKAVSAASVMGATKRIGERIVQQVARDRDRRFVVVRFGNVLASQGSVVQLFLEQIARGGPVTVTDPEMNRYFMTIPEAVRLILLAGAIGQAGQIYVLNMGQPIRIVDLARDLIRLSVGDDAGIEIEYVGLRPGEVMEESLFSADEEPIATEHESLLVARPTGESDGDPLAVARFLERLAVDGTEDELRTQVMEAAGRR